MISLCRVGSLCLGGFVISLSIGAPLRAKAGTSEPYVRVYVDHHKDVHAVTASRKDIRLTRRGRYDDPKLAPDGRTVGARIVSRLRMDRRDSIMVTEQVWLHGDRRIVRRIVTDGFVRDWGFWNGGKELAVYSGGLHFAGFYVLYDLASGRELERSKDPRTDQSPDWVRSLED